MLQKYICNESIIEQKIVYACLDTGLTSDVTRSGSVFNVNKIDTK